MISFVIPTLDEERLLPATLCALVSGTAGRSVEILVVDGGSTDRTLEFAGSYGGVSVVHSDRGRGRQMNVGARAARGSLLAFLPADTIVSIEGIDELDRVARRGEPAAGGFRQRFDRKRRFLSVVSNLHNARARLTGVFYGDQVPFVRRELFDAIGGFREDIDMEDVEYGARLRRLTRPKLLRSVVTTSARRFDRSGDLRATVEATRLLCWWLLARRAPRSTTFFRPVR